VRDNLQPEHLPGEHSYHRGWFCSLLNRGLVRLGSFDSLEFVSVWLRFSDCRSAKLQSDGVDLFLQLLVVAWVGRSHLDETLSVSLVGDGVVLEETFHHVVALLGQLTLEHIWLEILWYFHCQHGR